MHAIVNKFEIVYINKKWFDQSYYLKKISYED